MERILVTGGTGFLGSWVTRVLCECGYSPILLVRPNSNLKRLNGIPNIKVIRADEKSWISTLSRIKPTSMISLDWAGVNSSARNDLSQHENVGRITGIAKAAKKLGIGKYIGFGSQAEIGPVKTLIYENALTNPTTEYGKAKCVTRDALSEIFADGQVNFTWGRIFSVYGQLDSTSWFIPQMIKTFKNQQEFKMTKGDQIWNYLHAYDFATAVIKILENGRNLGIVNIANPTSKKLFNIATLISQIMSAEHLIKIGTVKYRDDQVMNLEPDISTLIKLGWESEIDFENGIEQLIDWHLGKSAILILKNNKKLNLPKIWEL